MIENLIFTIKKTCTDDDHITEYTGTLQQIELYIPDPIVDFIENFCPVGDEVFIFEYTMDICKVSVTKHTKDL